VRVFVAGATGAIGRYLVPRLAAAGHDVIATTRNPEKMADLKALGSNPVVLDGLDARAVGETVARAEADAIVHQMSALSGKSDLRHFDRWFSATNALRTRGTENLLSAAQAADVPRFVAQSYTGWTNDRTGTWVKSEEDQLDPNPLKEQSESLAAIRLLERMVTEAPLEGIALRYGNFYGVGGSDQLVELVRKRRFPIIGDGRGVWSWIHLDDAAAATVAALERGRGGIYNIADDEPARVAEWLPYLAEVVGAKPPLRVPKVVARVAAGRVPVRWMTEGRGVSNEKAKRELGWEPVWRRWRDGFRFALTEDSGAETRTTRLR
jgi:nucleoside-diphosphate-sugar epimerase